jgi:multicomponent K+:H+ antiporter subunit F
MLNIAAILVSTLIGFSLLLNLWRFMKGPHMLDRIIALDTMYINAIALIILLGIFLETTLYYEGALLIAMLGFVSTSAACKFILRGDIIE